MNIFETNITSMYGPHGKKWLDNLPELAQDIGSQYGLSHLTPVSNLSYNYVLTGFKDNLPIILKLGLDANSLKSEADALNAFANHGAVKILAKGERLLVLERAIPGFSLKSHWPHNDNEAMAIVAGIMKRLYQAPEPKQGVFPSIIDWLTALDSGVDIPSTYLEKARTLKLNLLNTCLKFHLLHGDLHHYNILSSQGEWVVIDPKGVMGEPAYEAAYFIRNPIPELINDENIVNIIHSRIKFFSATLGVPAERILDWCFVQSALSWSWAIEDGLDPTNFILLTKIFANLKEK